MCVCARSKHNFDKKSNPNINQFVVILPTELSLSTFTFALCATHTRAHSNRLLESPRDSHLVSVALCLKRERDRENFVCDIIIAANLFARKHFALLLLLADAEFARLFTKCVALTH